VDLAHEHGGLHRLEAPLVGLGELTRVALECNGFSVVRWERYAMVYRHEPGRAARLLSSRPLRPVVRFAIDGFNALLGGIGNKLTVQAVRRSATS
jgi:hypothetical protein